MSARGCLFLFLGFFAAAMSWFIQRDGWKTTWNHWHIPARAPHFSDLRAITGAADSIERGFDPREHNVGAPFGQRFNQTRVWLWLGQLGVRESHSTAVGLALVAGYAVALWWLCAGIGGSTALLLVVLLLSPAAMLAVERGTTDLSVFFLLALAAHVAGRSACASAGAVLGAFVLKLFPLAGIVVVLRERRGRAVQIAICVILLAAVFCWADFREIVDIGFKTEKGQTLSYGWAVLSIYLERELGVAADVALRIRWASGILAAIIALLACWRGSHVESEATLPDRPLNFMRVGAAVYAGSFALGASWDYRLIFVLFMVPQLTRWAFDELHGFRSVAAITLGSLVLATWSPAIIAAGTGTVSGWIVARAVEELSKWTLFATSVYLLTATLPPWLKLNAAGRLRATA